MIYTKCVRGTLFEGERIVFIGEDVELVETRQEIWESIGGDIVGGHGRTPRGVDGGSEGGRRGSKRGSVNLLQTFFYYNLSPCFGSAGGLMGSIGVNPYPLCPFIDIDYFL